MLIDWNELYQIVKTQATFALMRYEEPERRKDKIQELVCQSYELYKSCLERGKPIRKQDFKCFVTQRAKQVDIRSVCKKGLGGTSSIDPLSFVNRRATSPITVVEFSEWMTFSSKKIDDTVAFNIDFENYVAQLTALQKKILNFLILGYKAPSISELINVTSTKVRKVIREIQTLFVSFFKVKIKFA